MSFWSSIQRRIGLRNTDVEYINSLFGNFHARKLSNNTQAYLEEGYESNVDVYSVIKRISDVYKAVPTIVEQRQSDGTWDILEDSTIHDLMENPNTGKGYTWSDIEEMIVVYLLASGNSYMIGENGFTSTIKEVDILPPAYVEAITNENFFMPDVRYKFELNKTKRTYEGNELEHIMMFNPAYNTIQNSFNGLSLIQVAARPTMVGNDRWDADAALLQNRGAIGLISSSGDRPMTSDEAKTVQRSFDRDTTGTQNFGKIKVTNKDAKFIQMAMSSTDLQLIEKGVVNLRAICNVFGLDSSLFNDPANKTFNNRKEAEKALYTNVVMPIAEKICNKHTNFIAKNHYPEGNVRITKDFTEIEALQQDMKLEAEKDKIEMEGINIVLNMPIDKNSKILMLQERYEISDELATSLTTETNEPI